MKTTNETPAPGDTQELELVLEGTTPSAIEALERASFDVQISTAKKYPRSMETFKKRALDMVALDQETAASCIYRRPVGGGKVAEGMSIRMAEIVAACYGNIRIMSMVVEQTPQFVKCRSVAHDLESNVLIASEVIESTLDKHGNPYGARQRIVTAKAALKKSQRDATFSVIPRALCKPLMKEAYKVEAGGRTIEQRRTAAQDWIKSLGVDEKRVWGALGIKGAADLGDGELSELLGIRTAINDGEATIDEAFPLQDGEQAAAEGAGRPKRERRPSGAQAAGAALEKSNGSTPGEHPDLDGQKDPETPTAEDPKTKITLATPPAAAAPSVIKSLKDGEEILFKGCTVEKVEVDLIAMDANDQTGQPSVIAKISGPFEGTVYHIGGATVIDMKDPAHPKLEAAPSWKSEGPVNVTLKGLKVSDGAVMPFVQEIIVDKAATIGRKIRTL